MSLRHSALAAALLAVLLSPFVSRGAEPVPADSLAAALATYWAGAVADPRLSEAEREAFAKGFEEHFLKSDSLDVQYLRGAMMASQIGRSVADAATMGLHVDRAALASAMSAALRGLPTGFTQRQASDYIDRQVAPEEAAAFSLEAQEAFLADAAARPAAIKTASGLVFEVITEGEGPMPEPGSAVMAGYTGKLSDGSVFDSTEGEAPVRLSVDGVVPGMSEALRMMRPGGTYRITFPASLGYGSEGIRGVIPGGAALEFTVNLIEIIPIKNTDI